MHITDIRDSFTKILDFFFFLKIEHPKGDSPISILSNIPSSKNAPTCNATKLEGLQLVLPQIILINGAE